MRAALWLSGLFAAAVAVALFAGNNQGTITVFWPPWRVDVSLNLALLLLTGLFVLIHGALRGLSTLLELPRQAQRWRLQSKERAMHGALLDALAHLLAGRFVRARKAAQSAIAQERAIAQSHPTLPHQSTLRALAHLIAADGSHALQDPSGRDAHLQQALAPLGTGASEQILREGLQLRAARWALDGHDSAAALEHLGTLPQGAARRTLALRTRLKAARLSGQTATALETARLLAKHRAFSRTAAQSMIRSLATDLLDSAHDSAQLEQLWQSLERSERAMPDVAIHAAQRLAALGGSAAVVRAWLLPAWEDMLAAPGHFSQAQTLKLVRALEAGLADIDGPWLARIESAQQAQPDSAALRYLAGVACRQRQLWGKAEQLLRQATHALPDGPLRARAWRHLAELAQQRNDAASASAAWKAAALQAQDGL